MWVCAEQMNTCLCFVNDEKKILEIKGTRTCKAGVWLLILPQQDSRFLCGKSGRMNVYVRGFHIISYFKL